MLIDPPAQIEAPRCERTEWARSVEDMSVTEQMTLLAQAALLSIFITELSLQSLGVCVK